MKYECTVCGHIYDEAVEGVKSAAKKTSSNVDEAIALAIAAVAAKRG